MSLVRNSLWSLVGSVLPAVLAIPSAGLIARELGAERFGLFLLLTALVACAGVLDGGVTNAVTRLAAQRARQAQPLSELLGTGLLAVLACSLPVLAVVAWWQADVVLLVTSSALLRLELAGAVMPLAALVVLQLLVFVCYGLLEGLQRFRRLAWVKLANGVLAAVWPAAYVLMADHGTLGGVFWALVLARVAGLLVLFGPALWQLPIARRHMRWCTPLARQMFAFGGWVAVSNVIGLVMNYGDRFVLSAVLGVQQASAYLAATEMIGRMAPVPAALSASFFTRVCEHPNDEATLRRATQLMVGASAALCAVLGLWGDVLLKLWLGSAFQPESVVLLRILLLGFMLNALAHLPFAQLRAGGHSRATAMLHAIELLPFVVMLYVMVRLGGPTGAALAWVIRMGVDLVALLLMNRVMRRRANTLAGTGTGTGTGTGVGVGVGTSARAAHGAR
jgi:O-antigen/teichoic acid export membrane protein